MRVKYKIEPSRGDLISLHILPDEGSWPSGRDIHFTVDEAIVNNPDGTYCNLRAKGPGAEGEIKDVSRVHIEITYHHRDGQISSHKHATIFIRG